MAVYNTVMKKRNAANNEWDSVLPITIAENVLIDEDGHSVKMLEEQINDLAKSIVCFTFDDGKSEDSLTYSIFKEYEYPASFGLITDQIYNEGKNSLNNYKKYEKDGFEVFSHSASHAYLNTQKTDSILYRELEVSAQRLRTLGFSANGLIVPFSTIDAYNLAYAKRIYDYILIGGTGLNGLNSFKKKQLTRISMVGSGVDGCKALIDQAIKYNQLLIFYDHAVGATGNITEAQLREILTYLQNKISNNTIEVHNVKNAIAKYYGISTPSRDKKINEYNQLPLLSRSSWILENNTVLASKMLDVSFINETVRLTIPSNSVVGKTVTFANTITLPASVEALGDRLKFSVNINMSNSQYAYFGKFIEVSYLDDFNNAIITETKQIYPDNIFKDNYFIDLYPEYPLIPKYISKIKVSMIFNVLTSPTVEHKIYISDVILQFSNYVEKSRAITEKVVTLMSDNNTTPDVNGKEHLLISNTIPTTVANFITSDDVMEITIFFGNANTTITGNNLIRLNNGANWTPTAGSMLTLFKNYAYSSAWYEKSRTARTV